MLVKSGNADGMIGGVSSYTASILQAAMLTAGKKSTETIISSYGFLLYQDTAGRKQVLVIADCAVNIDPDARTLAHIAVDTGRSVKNIFEIEPYIAMLSFSTRSSNRHPRVKLVREATVMACRVAPDLHIDGEIQVDAALDKRVAGFKACESDVAGKANVLIFPNLEAANIGIKLIQYTAGALCIGAVIQGLAFPVSDVSRGATVDEIVGTVALTVIQSENR